MTDELVRMEKQKYLRDNVVDKGYSTEQFIAYLQGIRGKESAW